MIVDDQIATSLQEKELGNLASRRNFLKAAGAVVLGGVVMGMGGWIYITKIEPEWLEITSLKVQIPRLSPAFAGFRIAQCSDIHLSQSLTVDEFSEACQTILQQKPDAVLITGDFVDDRVSLRRWGDEMGKILAGLTAQVPVLAVLGNHDYRVGASQIRSLLQEAGVRLLINESERLERGGAALHIAGVDDPWRGRPDLNGVLEKIPDGEAVVLMAHEPDYAVAAARTKRVDLQLSGHSHGGQVVLPLVGPPVLPHLGKKFPSGRYSVGSLIQYTNRGLGTTSPHLRLNCRPEITVFELAPVDTNKARTGI